VLRGIDFLLKILRLIPCLFHLCGGEVAWIQTSTSLNHHKKMKAEPSRLITRKLSANLEFSRLCFCSWQHLLLLHRSNC